MPLCLWAGATVAALATPGFTLSWQHSVEKIEWREIWQEVPGGLRLEEAAVKGSGAGMEPGEGAELQNGWWVWSPGTEVAELRLAASGATGAGWQLCEGAICHELGAKPGEALVIAPCAE